MPRHRKQPANGWVLERTLKSGEVTYQLKVRVNSGKPRYRTLETGSTRRDADRALAVWLDQLNAGTYQERRELTFSEHALAWLSAHAVRLRPSGASRVANDLDVHLLPFFGDYYVHEISSQFVTDYVAEKVIERGTGDLAVMEAQAELAAAVANDEPIADLRRALYKAKRSRGLSPVSVNKTLTLLRQVLEAARDDGLIARNPVLRRHRLKVSKTLTPFLELEQMPVVVQATPERHRALICTLLLAGLRIGEACALRWRDVHLEAASPYINVVRNWDPASTDPATGKRGIEGPVKTGEEGTVSIDAGLVAVLRAHWAGSAFSAEGDLVFATSTGSHMSPSNVRQRVLVPAIARANEQLASEGKVQIPHLTPHKLRHTFCSMLIATGADLATAAAQMRHADPMTTARIYTHVMKHTRRDAAERLGAAFWGSVAEHSGRVVVARADSESSPVTT